jgi:transposase-like protein
MRLSDQDVRKARDLYAKGGVTQTDLAHLYGVGEAQMRSILRGERRPEAGGPLGGGLQRSVFTPEDVVALRERYAAGDVTLQGLAEEFGVDISTLSRLVRGHTYQHLGGPLTEPRERPPRLSKLTEAAFAEVLESQVSHSVLARRFGVSRQAISQLRKRHGWKARS